MTQWPPRPPHREALKFAPLERILLETDAPTAYQGKTSEPADPHRYRHRLEPPQRRETPADKGGHHP
ncbi:MAG: hypothetical protein ABIG94_02070 [Pseudomonadota bacterium]